MPPAASTSWLVRISALGVLAGPGSIDHGVEQLREPPSGRAVAGGQLGHLGEAQLRVRKRQAPKGLGGRRQQLIELLLVANPDAALLEQLQLAVKRPQADSQLGEDRWPGPGGPCKESNQTMKPSGALKRDVNRRSSSGVGLATHT